MRNEEWWWRLRREYIWGDARKSADIRFPYHRPFDRERKRFLASFEMTTQETDVSQSSSLLVTSHQSLRAPNP